MKFNENPYYSPERCGLEIVKSVDTAGSYEFDIFCLWKKIDTDELYWDTDSGCSCPSPFDNGDHGHDLKLITEETYYNFEQGLHNHYHLDKSEIIIFEKLVKEHLKEK